MLKVKELRKSGDLQSIAEQWDHLLEQSLNPSHALSWCWISNWLDVYLENSSILCLAVFDDEKLVGLAPLWVEKKRLYLLCGLRTLKFIGSEEVCGDHIDLIIHRKNSKAICAVIWEHLFGELRKEWDVWEYNNVASDSQVLQALRKLADADKRCLELAIHGFLICPYIDLPTTWETYLSSLSANQRRALKVSTEAMSQSGEVKLRFCDNADDLPAFMNTHIDLHKKSWHDRGQAGSFETESFRKFHRQYAVDLLSTQQLFLCNLELDDKPVGSLYGFVHNRVIYYYLLGVDRAAVPKASIGRVLLGKCIEEAIGRGYHRFDFLRGFEDYKYDWTDLERRELLVTFCNRSLGAVIFLLQQFVSRYSRQVLNLILGNKTQILKKWMGRGPGNRADK